MSKHVSQLAIFTGLDDETIKQQLAPYLDTFTSRQALVNHLQDLLGPGEAQRSFIESYANEKHNSKPSAPTSSQLAGLSPTVNNISVGIGQAGHSKKKSKFPAKLPPPRKINADAYETFGSAYRKGDADDGLFPISATSSGFSTPKDTAGSSAVGVGIGRSQSPVKRAEANASASDHSSALQPASKSELTLIPSDEMKAVQKDILLLRGESQDDPTAKAKPCFCQGRRHPIHSQVPLCMTCGLVLCSILHPSPLLLPSSPCPSCAAPILNTTSRAILLARLDMQLASLSQTHEEKIRLVQEERQKAWLEKRQEVELFPNLTKLSLQDGSSNATGSTSRQNQEYNHFYERRRAMDIAMGRRIDDDSERKARVIRIGGAASTRKKKGSNTSKKSSEPIKVPTKKPLDSVKKQEEEVQPSSGEESEDEVILDYDPLDFFNGPVPDSDDDGFARHAISVPPEMNTMKRDGNMYWAPMRDMPSLRYIPEKKRSTYVEPMAEGENDPTEKRTVPGAPIDS